MSEYGCRPCSGLDPPSRCKNVSWLCFGLGLAAAAGEVQRAARRPARSGYMQPIRCRASRRNRAAEPPACGPAAATRWTPGEGRGRRKRAPPAKLAPTSLGALRPLTTHAAPPGLRQAAQVHKSTRGTRQSGSDVQRSRRGLARRLSFRVKLAWLALHPTKQKHQQQGQLSIARRRTRQHPSPCFRNLAALHQ